jgi:hypothetical protein
LFSVAAAVPAARAGSARGPPPRYRLRAIS